MPRYDSVRPLNLFADYMAGRQAADDERAANQQNALRDMQIERARNLNVLSQNPNATPEQYIRAGDAQTGAALQGVQQDKQVALAQLGSIAQKALAIADPAQRKGFLSQAAQVYGSAFSAFGVNPAQGLAELQSLPDAELQGRLQQVAKFASPRAPIQVAAGGSLVNPETNAAVFTAPNPGQEETARHNRATEEIARMNAGKSAANKPIPVGALRMAQDARDALSVAAGIDSALMSIDSQIASGKLNLGPMRNLISRGQNVVGASDESSRNYQLMRSTLEKMRNDSLRLNKGVQTEGDAQRAWNELFASLNDENAVRAQLARIREINQRATVLQQENFDAVYENYGRTAPSTAPVTTRPSAQPAQVPTATGPNGQKLYLRNGQWVPQ